MTLRLQSFFAGLLALLTAALLALAPAQAKPASGGYQDFEPVALEHQQHIQLSSLENFDYFAKTASECCNATNRGIGAANLTERGTFTNRYPGDAAVLQSRPRTLVQDSSGRYWLEGPGGNRITPSGSYDFVTMPNGTVRVARPNTNQDYSTHLGLSGGGEVSYAGSIRFGNNAGPNRGTITNWTNNSGHYTPPAEFSGNAGLPSGSFTAHQ